MIHIQEKLHFDALIFRLVYQTYSSVIFNNPTIIWEMLDTLQIMIEKIHLFGISMITVRLLFLHTKVPKVI